MDNYNDNLHKGTVLMQQALKKYEEGDFEHAEKDREEANHFFDKANTELNTEEGKLTQLYGESRNFGIIYNVFEQNIGELFETENGKKIIKEGFQIIKNNPILSEQFKIYDYFENAKNMGDDTKDVINESINLINNNFKVNKTKIKESNEKFITFMKKNKLDEYVHIPEETEKLYEAIEYVILNGKKLNNLNEHINAQNIIVEHISKRNNEETKVNNDILLKTLKETINKEEEKFNNEINEDERKLIEDFINEKIDRKALFESYKYNTLKKLEETIENSEEEYKNEWKNIYENIQLKNFSEKNIVNIKNCAEMLEICETIDSK